jgi:putative membrane protein
MTFDWQRRPRVERVLSVSRPSRDVQQERFMDRRALLGGLAAALVVAPAFAQTSGSSSTMPSGSSGSMPMNRAGGQMSQADMQHMQQTMQLGLVALESSRIAMNKVRNDDLKRFANFEVQEQTTLSEVLRSMMDPGATAATGSASSQSGQSAMPAMQMDASARDMMQKMQNQQAGAEFDKMYLEAQLQGHRDLLQVQERYLQSNPQNREHMNVAKMARGHIREHIAMLEEMQKTMR